MKLKLGHIINLVNAPPSSDLYFAQPVTFETMRQAKMFARDCADIDLFTVQYPDDRVAIPDGFIKLPDLERSVLDVKHFEYPRKLPILGDILGRLYEASNADYFIYSNVDISLMPHFYSSVVTLLNEYDGLVINRRTISDKYSRLDEIPKMYAELGKTHPGYDCWVFPKDSFPKMQLGTACIGANYIGLLLYVNVLAQAEKFMELRESHLTFHIGDSRVWQTAENEVYALHNSQELETALRNLHQTYGPFDMTTLIGRYLLKRYQRSGQNHLKETLKLDNSNNRLKQLRVSYQIKSGLRTLFHKGYHILKGS